METASCKFFLFSAALNLSSGRFGKEMAGLSGKDTSGFLSAGAACDEAEETEGAEAGVRLIAATAPPAVTFDISEAIVVRPFSKKHETHANARFSLGTMHSEKFNAAENRKNLQEAVSMLNQQVASHKNGLGFSINDSIDVPVVTVKNTVTGEVVRQIPNEVVIRVAQNIDIVQKGLLHNSKV